jgi:DNA polymerase-3 subunit delta'
VSWQRVRGHQAQVEAFDLIWRRGRLAHAYLFTGPPGVGKRLFAEELAKALLCEGRGGPDAPLAACDKCPSCQLIDGGTHPDFFLVGRPEDSNEVPIEVMRELCRGFTLRTARGRGKVAVLDDADDLNDASANCFLKTLEEPPPRSLFILVGTSLERQLPTIVSRCQVVRFAPLPEPLVLDLLKQRDDLDAALLPRLARLADGSPGQALALADPDLWAFREKFLEQLVRPDADVVALSRAFMEFVEEAGKESAAQRRRASLVVRLLIEFLRDALAVALGTTPRLAEPDDLRRLRALTERVDAERLLDLIERCLEAEVQIERYVQLVLVVEALVDALGVVTRRPPATAAR